MTAQDDKTDSDGAGPSSPPPNRRRPPPPPPLQRHSSVRLSQGWMDDSILQAVADAVKEGIVEQQPTTAADGSVPIPVVAFFPLPQLDKDAPPPSPRTSPQSRKVITTVIPEADMPLIDLAMPTSDVKVKPTAAAKSTDDERSDTAKAAVQDFQSDADFSSVGTVASREFSEHMADEIWEDVPMGPADAILGVAAAYRACTDARKVNVCVGAYRDGHGKPWVLPSVKRAEQILWQDDNQVKEYLPMEGDADFVRLAMKFAYGPEMPLDHLAAVQTVRGLFGR